MHITRCVSCAGSESAAEASPPHTPVASCPARMLSRTPEDVKQPNNSMAAASPAARTPPQAPRVRALKRLMQTKNRCCGECTPTWHHCLHSIAETAQMLCQLSQALTQRVVDPLLRALAGRHRRYRRPASWRGALYGPPWRRYSTSPAGLLSAQASDGKGLATRATRLPPGAHHASLRPVQRDQVSDAVDCVQLATASRRPNCSMG